MLGERSEQRGLWEADRLYIDHVGRGSFYSRPDGAVGDRATHRTTECPRKLAPPWSASGSFRVLCPHLAPRAHRRPPSAPPRAPAGRPATSRLPESSPDNRACNSLTPFRCPHAVHLYESVDSGLERLCYCQVRAPPQGGFHMASASHRTLYPVPNTPSLGNGTLGRCDVALRSRCGIATRLRCLGINNRDKGELK